MADITKNETAHSSEWEKHIDCTTNTAYYFNARTGESSWQEPEGFENGRVRKSAAAAKTAKETHQPSHSPRWRKYFDDNTGGAYYHDEANDVTQWERPEGFGEACSGI
ncbi:TPA: hypothetical protein N0F65_001817 [Lagenidium giganteum]|uniref:WW domain-containing protein n=1 Tax=Lagenidium giganteum TaxID=4803 RepID=A0AAV2Z3R7_9STRA|nr:TPA: hypothetical protein N0F65_001817 [Lagenidium giganteum]